MNEYLKLLGHKCKDKVTGFEGVVASVCFDLYGCVQVALSPECHEGKLPEGHWFDHKRIVVLDKKRVMEPCAFEALQPGQEHGPAEKPHRAF